MGDRVRLGEFLAAMGGIWLAALLAFAGWFTPTPAKGVLTGGGILVDRSPQGSVGAAHLGWFAFAVTILSAAAAIVFVARVLTARGPERPMLQAPVAFAIGVFAAVVVIVRLGLFFPGIDIAVPGEEQRFVLDASLTTAGWIGVLAVLLIPIGAWIAMHDERTGSAAAKRRTAELLADVPIRQVPHVAAPADPDSAVVADDAIATDPTSPSSPASGGPA